MIFSIATIVLVVALGYYWVTRGFFSALLHFACTLAAGAVAFAAWEPLSVLILNSTPTTGFLRFLPGLAWTAGLVLPFALSLIVFRVAMDQIVGGNIKVAPIVDYIGGGVFGGASAVLAVGILTIGLSFGRFSTTFLGYQPLVYNEDRSQGAGSLIAGSGLWLPVDQIAAGVYGGLSKRAFFAGNPLGDYYPNLHRVGFAGRLTNADGAGRNVIRDEHFRVDRMYTVGNPQNGSPAGELLADMRSPIAQPYTNIEGEPVGSGYLLGTVITFTAEAKDEGSRGAGQVVVSNGQLRLLVRDAEGQTQDVFPVAVISQASAGDNVFARWRFESEGDLIASVGGASQATMAFEFFVPSGATPEALYVRNTRVGVDANPEQAFAGVAQRDALVADGSILRGGQAGGDPTSRYNTDNAASVGEDDPSVRVTNRLGTILNVTTAKRGLQINDNAGNIITGGEGQFTTREASRQSAPTEASLQVKEFGIAQGQSMVQVDVSDGRPASLLSDVARLLRADEPIRLIDTNGQAYDAVGYIYNDREGLQVRYTPSAPMEGPGDAPALSTSRADQRLTLLFIVSEGVDIRLLAIGDDAIIELDPPRRARNR